MPLSDSLAAARISLAVAALGAVAVIAALIAPITNAPVPIEGLLVALAADPCALNAPVAVGAAALTDVVAALEVSAASLGLDLGRHVLPPNSDQRSGEGPTAEGGKRLPPRPGTGQPLGQGIENLIVHTPFLSPTCGMNRRSGRHRD